MKKIMVEGHRGYCARYPENTLVSYRAAVDAHVDAIEFDVWLSSDKVPVIMHDGNVSRTTNGTGHLREMTLAEIKELDAGSKFSPAFAGERVPTLRETLEVICSDPHICPGVEIKEYTEETVDLTIAMLKEFGCLERCFFYCFNARIIRYLKQRYGVRTMGYPERQMQEFYDGAYDDYDEVGISMSILTPELAKFFDDLGKPMHIYCCDTDEAVNTAISYSPKLITANEVAPLIRILEEKGLRAD